MYYYECEEEFFETGTDTFIYTRWGIYDQEGNKIDEGNTEENANLIVTLMNGVG